MIKDSTSQNENGAQSIDGRHFLRPLLAQCLLFAYGMSQPAQEIKIRALPRKAKAQKPQPNGVPRWIIYVGASSTLLLIAAFLLPTLKVSSLHLATKSVGSMELSSQIPSSDPVSRHLRESLMRQQMMRGRRQLENMDAKAVSPDETAAMLDSDPNQVYGVQFDSEDTADRLYQELNDRVYRANNDGLPDDRINARLANRKWVNEMEHQDRVLFVRNFIRWAHDRGYDIQLDQNLVVVGAKPITAEQKVDIEQVLTRMAQQGR